MSSRSTIDSGSDWEKRGSRWASSSSNDNERAASFAFTLVVSLVMSALETSDQFKRNYFVSSGINNRQHHPCHGKSSTKIPYASFLAHWESARSLRSSGTQQIPSWSTVGPSILVEDMTLNSNSPSPRAIHWYWYGSSFILTSVPPLTHLRYRAGHADLTK